MKIAAEHRASNINGYPRIVTVVWIAKTKHWYAYDVITQNDLVNRCIFFRRRLLKALLNKIEEEFEKDYTDKRPDLENFPDPLNNTDNPRSFTPI